MCKNANRFPCIGTTKLYDTAGTEQHQHSFNVPLSPWLLNKSVACNINNPNAELTTVATTVYKLL